MTWYINTQTKKATTYEQIYVGSFDTVGELKTAVDAWYEKYGSETYISYDDGSISLNITRDASEEEVANAIAEAKSSQLRMYNYHKKEIAKYEALGVS